MNEYWFIKTNPTWAEKNSDFLSHLPLQKEIVSYLLKNLNLFVTFIIARQIPHKQKNILIFVTFPIVKRNTVLPVKKLKFFLLHLSLQNKFYIGRKILIFVTFTIAKRNTIIL